MFYWTIGHYIDVGKGRFTSAAVEGIWRWPRMLRCPNLAGIQARGRSAESKRSVRPVPAPGLRSPHTGLACSCVASHGAQRRGERCAA
jgi:hypothetical protein